MFDDIVGKVLNIFERGLDSNVHWNLTEMCVCRNDMGGFNIYVSHKLIVISAVAPSIENRSRDLLCVNDLFYFPAPSSGTIENNLAR